MAIPAVLTSMLADVAVSGAAVALMVVVARFLVFGVLFVGTPLEPFRGELNDDSGPDYSDDYLAMSSFVDGQLSEIDEQEFGK